MLGNMIAPLVATRIGAALGIPVVFAFVGIVMIAGSVAIPFLASGRQAESCEENIL
jgi:hypothetical protein